MHPNLGWITKVLGSVSTNRGEVKDVSAHGWPSFLGVKVRNSGDRDDILPVEAP